MSATVSSTYRNVGKGLPRRDGEEKVRGLAAYADDIPVPDGWHGWVVRSPVSRGRLKKLNFDPAFDWSRVCVVTPEDIPGENVVDMVGRDMPFIAHDWIQFKGEPIALVAAPTRALAREAASHITPEIEEQPAILTLREVVDQFQRDPKSLHEMVAQTISKGSVEQGFAEADVVVEGEYWSGHQEQLYIEPQGMVAFPEPDGGIFIQGSLQCPYYVAPELIVTLNLPLEKIRVKQTAVGGGFGGKEDFPTLIAGYCALLAMKCGKPVKIIFDRNQDILYTTKRHPSWVRHRTGLKRDGTITAMKVDFLLDGGAYTTLSPVVLYRGILHSTLGYKCPHVYVDGHVYRTNTFPNGAFRGFGAPQAIWALESHMDRCAHKLDMAPEAFRLHNALRLGDTTATGQTIAEAMGTPTVLENTLAHSQFVEKQKRCSRGDPKADRWYGIGLSFFAHGAGFTGDGESRLKAKAALDLEILDDGEPGINIRISSTEMGQGTFTIMPQIAADGLAIPLDRVCCPHPDTKYVPDSGPTVASRTTMIVGSTVFDAARKLKTQLETYASETFFGGAPTELNNGLFKNTYTSVSLPFERVAKQLIAEKGPQRVYHQFQLPASLKWDQKTFKGDSYPSYSWGCNVAEVEVNPLTLEIKVLRITSTWDIGRVINPVLAKGQVEGGLTQALGYAVMEKMGIKNGVFDANRMQTYVVPTSMDVPEMDIHFVEYPYTHTALGAKGVGEVSMDGLAPSVANAVEAATGVRLTEIPITPEKLWEKLRETASSAI
ncbi:MAG: xanthine dehydrogenase family protein molybdopterin-binding subunit [Kiritimatiellae bacterium]|nr:xanthine dehydrogenase family protein molybdopterin-binding subunit [Kiritimatiellia bacterium]